jgi:aerobic-type carbon monoxide dehydrogenase small subunit (CoxS/CutS family)
MTVSFTLDGRQVEVGDERCTLLEALRDRLGERGPKDGCSPQGQCGCCTVLVDGQPRVACVTPVRRIGGRHVRTIHGLDDVDRSAWAEAFAATGASQCGFCTPGIMLRLEALRTRGPVEGHQPVEQALLAHLCRCTGWRTILEAWDRRVSGPAASPVTGRDLAAAARRAELEGGVRQRVGPEVALGQGGFADDGAPATALVAVPDGRGGYAVGDTLAEARATAGKVQGRHSTAAGAAPLLVPEGRWDVTLQTGWVEPAYLETDASWCEPGGEPANPLGNGGAFGGKASSPVGVVARRLADEHGRAVRVLWSREDVVRFGAKRPPLAAGIDRAGRRVAVRVARTPGVADALARGLGVDGGLVGPGPRPGFDLDLDLDLGRDLGRDLIDFDIDIEEVDVPGPPTSLALRGAGWAEGLALRCALDGGAGRISVRAPGGGRAVAEVRADRSLAVEVDAGEPLDEVVLRSYAIGAAHMALGWVTSEGITVDEEGHPVDLTVRSFGVLRAVDTPKIDVRVVATSRPPVNGSDAVFAAVAAAVWSSQGFPPVWPTGVRQR